MTNRPSMIGINHVALEVGDLEEALDFYGDILEITLRGRVLGMAFVDMGDQFIALSEGREQAPDAAAPLRTGRRRPRRSASGARAAGAT